MYCLRLNWTMNAKSLKTISDERYMFLAATFSSTQARWQPKTYTGHFFPL